MLEPNILPGIIFSPKFVLPCGQLNMTVQDWVRRWFCMAVNWTHLWIYFFQPDAFGMEDPGVISLDALKHLLQEASDHVRSFLKASHSKKKHYYDKRNRLVTFTVNDLVRVKTHQRSDSSTNFVAKLALPYTGPYRVAQNLSDVNYRLADVTMGKDMGVFHVVNMELFRTWHSGNVSKKRCL